MTADAVGGVWTYALELSRALGARGVRVALATMGPRPSAAQRSDALSVPGLTLHESDFALEWMDEPWDGVQSAGEWLLELERTLRPDLVHLDGYCHGALPFRAPVLVVGHSCVLSWFEAVKGCAAPPQYDRYREEVARGLRGATLVVTPSAAMLAALHRFYGPFAPAQVIPNGRAVERFDSAEHREPFVLAAGRLWDEAKNLRALDEAAASIPWPVRVAGDARHPQGHTISARHAQLLGSLSPKALFRQMSLAAIYALPARYEPFGLSALEAALCGCALVLGDIASLRENWDGCARFVDPDRPDELAAVVGELIADPAERAALSSRAQSRARTFTATRMAEAYFATCRALLPARSSEAVA